MFYFFFPQLPQKLFLPVTPTNQCTALSKDTSVPFLSPFHANSAWWPSLTQGGLYISAVLRGADVPLGCIPPITPPCATLLCFPFPFPDVFLTTLPTLPLNSGPLCPLHKLFVLLKPRHATNTAFHLVGHSTESVLFPSPWLVLCPRAKQNLEQVSQRALPALQPALQKDDSTVVGWFFRLVVFIQEALNGLLLHYYTVIHVNYLEHQMRSCIKDFLSVYI